MIIRQLGMVGNGWRYFCHLQPLYPVRRLVVQQHRSSIWTSTNIPRNVNDPRALAIIFEQAEAKLEREAHPDPYRRESSAVYGLPEGRDTLGLTLPSTHVPRRHEVVCTNATCYT